MQPYAAENVLYHKDQREMAVQRLSEGNTDEPAGSPVSYRSAFGAGWLAKRGSSFEEAQSAGRKLAMRRTGWRSWRFCSAYLAVIGLFLFTVGPCLAAGPAAVLPPASAVPGWKMLGKPRLYNRDNLYQLIDGGAEAVNQYAFTQCAHGEYAPAKANQPSLTIDVYDMTDPLNSFGLFGFDRQSGAPVHIGVEGVRIGTTGLDFWKGRYVVRMAIVERTPTAATRAAMEKFAKAAAARIPAAGGMPALIKALPPGYQPRSEKYTLRNAAGQSFLSNAVSARYPSLGMGAELFIAQYPTPAAAARALNEWRAREKTGTGLASVAGIGNGGFSVQDRFMKQIVAVQKGRYLVFVVRAKDAAKAKELVKRAAAKV